MKKYQNVSQFMSFVEFETHTQFLRRGQSVVTDEKATRVPDEIEIIDIKKSSKRKSQ